MKSDEIRQQFVDFFVARGHKHVPSAPLVPPDDPTLLFTTAGMVQFKPLYAGRVELPYRRACSVQKCLRAGGKGSDLENVGRTLRHHTFFEMLGNFSFGDYFKREALNFAWEFSTKVVKLDPARLYVSVFTEDDEAWDIWTKEIGVAESHMVRLGVKDNFWGPAGETGACGPCSEIYYDRGEKYGPGLSFQDATINDDDPGTRYIEYWNCVFPQFDQQKDGSRPPLKNRGVDTGMSVERLACITQDAASLYETDVMTPIVNAICTLVGIASYKESPIEVRQSVNVIADHVRALTFALSEGILPSNEGRGYVMRRLLRRAARYARHLGQEKPFMFQVVDAVIEVMGSAYPEIKKMPDLVKRVIRLEEEGYAQTLGTGLLRLEALLTRAEGKQISGSEAFTLSATFGLPFDDILEIATERGFEVDYTGYLEHVARHREESRKGAKGARFEGIYEQLKEIFASHGKTAFVGYAPVCPEGKDEKDVASELEYPVEQVRDLEILAVFKGEEQALQAQKGDQVAIVLDKTPFYAESGGQVGDTGILQSEHASVRVHDVQKTAEDIYVHYGVVESGELLADEKVTAQIDTERRWAIMRNHTATHLLQGALKQVVGAHITQQGSYVGPEYLRFDFTNPEAVNAEQLAEIERLVNEQILRNQTVESREMMLEEARKTGAIAPFGEKYGTRVRVVNVAGWDIEFCGGTHMPATGGIGMFVVLAESAIASGVRRIEATTGLQALATIQAERATLKGLAEELSVPKEKVPERVGALQDDMKELRKQMSQMRAKFSAIEAGDILEAAKEIGGVKFVAHSFQDLGAQELREMFDAMKTRRPSALFAVLASVADGRVTLIAGATPDVVARGISAGDIIKRIGPIVGGSGGGKKEMAQAGGKNPEKIAEALASAEEAFMATVAD